MNTILIIEDDLEIRKMIRDFLELQKYTVITAEDGKQGLELTQKIIPDLIISDVNMPEMNGFELKEKLARNEVTEIVPFIFLTSQSDRKDFRKGMELGADDYLTKPFNIDELSATIDVQLNKRRKLIKEYSRKVEEKPNKELNYNEHILIKVNGVPKFIKINDIIYITADAKYTRVKLTSGEKLIISKSLNEWEDNLPANFFVRIHRGHIVNIEQIEKVEKWFNQGYMAKLKGESEPFVISRRYYSKLRDLFGD